ncbi:MAG: hexose kinase [Acidobacteria bacterium]|nr:hexose kinase [Acidobacteriota bacterium]
MLLAVTPNPAIDRVVYVPRLKVGSVHRALETWLSAGGKGMNVARVAQQLGYRVRAVAPLAGHTGTLFAEASAREGLQGEWFWLQSGETRTCLLAVHEKKDATVINEPGPVVSLRDWTAFLQHVQQSGAGSSATTFSGSLLPGADAVRLVKCAQKMSKKGRLVYVDASGDTLRACLNNPAGLCVKANENELATVLRTRPGKRDLLRLAADVICRGGRLLVITRGDRGAIAVSAKEILSATAPKIKAVSTVGCGDSFLAGLVVKRMADAGLEEALRCACACGAADAVTPQPGTLDTNQLQKLTAQVRITRF